MSISDKVPEKYRDLEYQLAHSDTYAHPIIQGIDKVLPPGVSQVDFDQAVASLMTVLGKDAVFVGDRLKEYVDPYEVPESGHERRIPGAAVW